MLPSGKVRKQIQAEIESEVPVKRRCGRPRRQTQGIQSGKPDASFLVQRDNNAIEIDQASILSEHTKIVGCNAHQVGDIDRICPPTVLNGQATISVELGSDVNAVGSTSSLTEDTTGIDTNEAKAHNVDPGSDVNVVSLTSSLTEDATSINTNEGKADNVDPEISKSQSTIIVTSSDVQPKVDKVDLVTVVKGGKITFADAMAKLTGVPATHPPKSIHTADAGVYLEDINRCLLKSLPVKCMVTDASLQDELLKDNYIDLPPLALGLLKSWSDRTGTGTTRFSGWFSACPTLEFTRAINAVQFVADGRYVNPSRVNPTILSTRDVLGNQTRYLAEVKSQGKWITAVFVTPIRVLQSYLLEGARGQKFLSGAAHGQEWERMAAVLCMIIGEQVVKAQIVGCDLSFSTRMSAARISAYKKVPSTSDDPIVNTSPSPASITMTGGASTSRRQIPINGTSSQFIRSVLEDSDTVPVFDARDHAVDFEFTATSLSQLEKSLPLFGGEIPDGSLAAVAYTATYYYRDGDRSSQSVAGRFCNLSANLQWVVVLGTPE